MAYLVHSYRKIVLGCTFFIESVDNTTHWRLIYCVGAESYLLQRCATPEACALLFHSPDLSHPDWKLMRERLPDLALPPDIHDLTKWIAHLP